MTPETYNNTTNNTTNNTDNTTTNNTNTKILLISDLFDPWDVLYAGNAAHPGGTRPELHLV